MFFSIKMFDKLMYFLQQENATVAGQKVKEGVSSLLGGLTKALTIDAEDLHKPLSPQYSGPPFFDRSKVSLVSANKAPLLSS